MAVNKNFVVKNGLEVNDDLILANAVDSMVGIGTSVPYYELHVQGGIGATSLWVAGVSTFTSDVSVAGVTTLASAGGITTVGGDLFVGGDLSVLGDVTYDEVVGRNLNITGVGTILNVVVGSGLSVTGISTLTGPVGMETGLTVAGVTTLASAGGITTTGGDLYVGRDLFVLNDVTYDEATGRNLNITGVATIAQANITTVNVSSASTFVGVSTFTDVWVGGGMTVAGNLDVTGDITYDEVVGRNLSITGVGTITRLNTTSLVGTSGTITTLNSTTGTITQLTNTDFVSTSSTITSIVGTSATITRISNTDFVGTGATITTGAIVQLTNTDLVSTSSTITSIVGTSATITRLNTTSLVGTSATITSIIGTTATIARLNTTSLVGTSATITSGINVSGHELNVGLAFSVSQAGVVTATKFVGEVDSTSGNYSGVGTFSTLHVGTSGTVLAAVDSATISLGSGANPVTATLNGGSIPSIGLAIALGG